MQQYVDGIQISEISNKRIYISPIHSENISNYNNFWSFIKVNNLSFTFRINTYNNVVLKNPTNISNAFANSFANSYYTLPVNTHIFHSHSPYSITNIRFNENDVLIAIKKLEAKMTYGPDQIPAFIDFHPIVLHFKPLFENHYIS